MTLKTAQKELAAARIQARELREHISELREIIWNYGVDPDRDQKAMFERNRQFFIQWTGGKTFAEIGRDFGLTGSRVSSVCRFIIYSLKNKKARYYNEYKILNKYLD